MRRARFTLRLRQTSRKDSCLWCPSTSTSRAVFNISTTSTTFASHVILVDIFPQLLSVLLSSECAVPPVFRVSRPTFPFKHTTFVFSAQLSHTSRIISNVFVRETPRVWTHLCLKYPTILRRFCRRWIRVQGRTIASPDLFCNEFISRGNQRPLLLLKPVRSALVASVASGGRRR